MRFVIYGAGAVGGLIGGRLAQHGADVVLVARGPHLEAIRAHGLRIADPTGTATVRVPAVAHPGNLSFGDDDVVVLAMKSQHTSGALDDLAATAPPSTPIVCAQNGVENERRALRRFERVHGMCVMTPAEHLEPGAVVVYSTPCAALLDIGRFPAGIDDVDTAVAGSLTAAGFDSIPRADIMAWKHTKLLMNTGNAIEAVCAPGEGAMELVTRAREEAIACFDAAGISYVDDATEAERRGTILSIRPVDGHRRAGGSSWQSLRRRADSIEVDDLNGQIVLLGRLHGVPTPVNAVLQQVAHEVVRSGEPPGSRSATDLLALADRETS